MDRQIDELVDSFPWHSFKDGKIVDVGGGSGHISVALGRVSELLIPIKVYDHILIKAHR